MWTIYFNPRSPCGLRPIPTPIFAKSKSISIHAAHAGCDVTDSDILRFTYFNPRSPCGLRRINRHFICWFHTNFNPRSPCGLRLMVTTHFAGDDNFNPRSPCGLRLLVNLFRLSTVRFQSTQPMRAATVCRFRQAFDWQDFNPRSPCGLRQQHDRAYEQKRKFQSTQPMRAATTAKGFLYPSLLISIHAAHAGCDVLNHCFYFKIGISIHAAHAGCDASGRAEEDHNTQFQSTQPMRAATANSANHWLTAQFCI